MKGYEIRFYADRHDFIQLFSAIDSLHRFRYTSTLSELNRPPTMLSSAIELLPFLRERHPESPTVFLIMNFDQEAISHEIRMQDGSGVKLKSDQLANPDAVLIRLGGVIEDKMLVATTINTMADTQIASRNFKELKKIVLGSSVCMQGFYVMRGAEKKLRDGWRLTPDPGFSRDLDLVLPT